MLASRIVDARGWGRNAVYCASANNALLGTWPSLVHMSVQRPVGRDETGDSTNNRAELLLINSNENEANCHYTPYMNKALHRPRRKQATVLLTAATSEGAIGEKQKEIQQRGAHGENKKHWPK